MSLETIQALLSLIGDNPWFSGQLCSLDAGGLSMIASPHNPNSPIYPNYDKDFRQMIDGLLSTSFRA
jgi:hypothetical protein